MANLDFNVLPDDPETGFLDAQPAPDPRSVVFKPPVQPHIPTSVETAAGANYGSDLLTEFNIKPEELTPEPEAEATWTWEDLYNSVLSGAHAATAANYAALRADANDDPEEQQRLTNNEKVSRDWAKYYAGQRSPGAQAALDAGRFTWDSLKSAPLHLGENLVPLLEVVVPAVFTEGIGTAATLLVAGGITTAGQAADRMYEGLDDIPTAEYVKTPQGQKWKAQGVADEEIKRRSINAAVGYKPAVVGLIGGLANMAVPGMLLKGVPGGGKFITQLLEGFGIGAAAGAGTAKVSGELTATAYRETGVDKNLFPEVDPNDEAISAALFAGPLGAAGARGRARVEETPGMVKLGPDALGEETQQPEGPPIVKLGADGLAPDTNEAIKTTKPPSASAPGAAPDGASTPEAPAAPGAGDLAQRVADLDNEIETRQAVGEDTTALEKERAAAQAALDAAPKPAPAAAAGEAPPPPPPTVDETPPPPPPTEVAGGPEVVTPTPGETPPPVTSGSDLPPTDLAPNVPVEGAPPIAGPDGSVGEPSISASPRVPVGGEAPPVAAGAFTAPDVSEVAPVVEAAPGAKGEAVKAAGKGRVLEDTTAKGPTAGGELGKKVAENVKALKTEAAKEEPKTPAEVVKGRKEGTAKTTTRGERIAALEKALTDHGPGTWHIPKDATGWQSLHERVTKLRDEILAMKSQPAQRIDPTAKLPGAHFDLMGREILDLAKTMDTGNTKGVVEHVGEFVGRSESAKGGDFKEWFQARKEGGYAKRKGGTSGKKSEDLTEAMPETAYRQTGEKATDDRPEVGKSRVLSGKELEEAAAKYGGVAKRETPEVTPGKAGTTAGKTAEVTPEKPLPPKVAEKVAVAKKAEPESKTEAKTEAKAEPKVEAKKPAPPKKPDIRSDEGLDAELKRATARVEGLRDFHKRAGPAYKTSVGIQLRAAEAHLQSVIDRAAARNKVRTDKEVAPPEPAGDAPTPEEIQKARKDSLFWGQRVRELTERGPDAVDDLEIAMKRLRAARDILQRSGHLPGEQAKSPSIIGRIKQTLAGNPVETLNKVLRAMRTSLVVPDARITHTFRRLDGSTGQFKSVFDTTVGKLMDNIGSARLARHIYGADASVPGAAVIDRIVELARDTPVHFVDRMRDAPFLDEGYGTHVYTGSPEGRIFFDLNELSFGSRDPQAQNIFFRTVAHEALHEVTIHAYETDNKFRAEIDSLLAYAKEQAGPDSKLYGLTDGKEFITEGFTNPEFHAFIRDIKAPKHIVKALGLDKASPTPSVLDAMVGYIRKLFGRGPQDHSLFDALVRSVERVQTDEYRAGMPARTTKPLSLQSHALNPGRTMAGMANFARDAFREATDRPAPDNELGKVGMMRFADNDYIARRADDVFGRANNPVRSVVSIFNRIRVDSARFFNETMPLTARMFAAERKFGADQWGRFLDVLYDATNAGIHAHLPLTDKAHAYLGKDALLGTQAKARHAAIHARWRALPQELKQLRSDLLKHYTTQQNRMTLETIRNKILRIAEIPLDKNGEALAHRIFLDKMTEADKARLGDLAGPIQATNVLSKINGDYVPLIRRGDHVVVATYRVAPPRAAHTRIRDDNGELLSVYEFGAGANANKAQARKDAKRYAASLPMDAKVKSVWVNEKTGKLYQEGPDVPAGQKVLSQDPNADHRWRVVVQDQHVEFVQGRKAANRRRNELLSRGNLFDSVDNVVERRNENFARSGYLASQLRTMTDSLEKRPGWRTMTNEMQNDMRAVLREASARLYSSTRIESRSLPRRYVAGHGREATKDLLTYSRAASARTAQLSHGAALDAALERMNTMAGSQGDQVFGRSTIANEINQRAVDPATFAAGKNNPIVNRLMGLTFTTNMASPATTMINMTQNPMLTAPILAGRHGPFRTVRALSKAYADIAPLKQLGKGVTETGRAVVNKDTDYSYLTDILARIKDPREKALIQQAIDDGIFDPEVGLEVSGAVDRYNATTRAGQVVAAGDAALNWMQTMARHLPMAAEVLNRAPALLASYRLERGRGIAHTEAMQRAFDVVNQTQFNYSSSNRAPVFNKPLVRLLAQFKQYPIHVIRLYTEMIGKAVRNINPGDRAEALRSLGYMSAAQIAFAGILGLPTEPFKLIMVGLGAMGFPVPSWREMEDYERQAASWLLGEWGGRAVSLGIFAALGINLNPRLGMQNLLTFGEPTTYGHDDVAMWTMKQALGASFALGDQHYLKGFQDLFHGNWGDALKDFSPLKFITNTADAAQKLAYGKVSASGRQTDAPYTIPQAVTKALGFSPTAESEAATARSLFYTKTAGLKGERVSLLNQWYEARGGGTTAALYKQIRDWNEDKPYDEQLTMAQLTDYVRRRDREKIVGGVRMSNPADERRIQDITSGVYGP